MKFRITLQIEASEYSDVRVLSREALNEARECRANGRTPNEGGTHIAGIGWYRIQDDSDPS